MSANPKLLAEMRPVTIIPMQSTAEAEACAQMMSESEPWITLNRGYTELLKAVQNPTREIFLAKVAGQVSGLIMINMQGAFTGYIQAVCVAPQWRSQGIGRQLMEAAEDRIFARTPNVFLCVSNFNKDAQKFYRELNYEIIGELKDYLVAGYSEILMRKTVGPLVGYDPALLVKKEQGA